MTECLPIPRDLGRREESGLLGLIWPGRARGGRKDAAQRQPQPEVRLRRDAQGLHVIRRHRPDIGRRTLMDAVIDKYLEHAAPHYDENFPPMAVDVLV